MAKQQNRRAVFKEVVQLPLLPDAEARIEGVLTNTEELLNGMKDLVTAGYEVAFLKDSNNPGGVTCRLFGADPLCLNDGLMLYSNADSWQAALAVALYKHFLVAKGGFWKESTSTTTSRYS